MSYPALPFIIIDKKCWKKFEYIIVLINGKLLYAQRQLDGLVKIGENNFRIMRKNGWKQPTKKCTFVLSFPIEMLDDYGWKPFVEKKYYDGKTYNDIPFVEMLEDYIDLCTELALKYPELRCMFEEIKH
jgi:hypothetical protein